MVNKKTAIFAGFFILLLASLGFVSALTISNVEYSQISPGKEGDLTITVKNALDEKVEDVSLSLIFKGTSFAPVGSSENSVTSIKSDGEKDFAYNIRASSDIKPGDYEIPYVISYKLGGVVSTQQGTIGIRITGDPEIVFSVSSENPVIGQKGKIILKIINKGFGDARFVSITASNGNGFTLLSEAEVYIGNINSDDFETASYDVMFNGKGVNFNAIMEYKDSNGKVLRKNISLPVGAYTRDEAISLGIITKSNLGFYVGLVILIIIVWIVWRTIKKSRRLKKSREMQNKNSAN